MSDDTVTVWQPSNIYRTAKLGHFVSIGAFSEVGNSVTIGSRSRVGCNVFIPEGVTIGADCFIGPKVCFTNDKYPPSAKEKWQTTLVGDRAAIGAGSVILCGITIGHNSTIGAGSVVTKSVPPNEIWAGNPAKRIRKK